MGLDERTASYIIIADVFHPIRRLSHPFDDLDATLFLALPVLPSLHLPNETLLDAYDLNVSRGVVSAAPRLYRPVLAAPAGLAVCLLVEPASLRCP
jgi:hypothetical protein